MQLVLSLLVMLLSHAFQYLYVLQHKCCPCSRLFASFHVLQGFGLQHVSADRENMIKCPFVGCFLGADVAIWGLYVKVKAVLPPVQQTACPTKTRCLDRINLVPTLIIYQVSEYMILARRLEK